MDLSFYRGKRVLVTGHTGFKGSWLCRILLLAGADVTGYALEPPTKPSLFELANLEKQFKTVTGDICNKIRLEKTIEQTQPEIVFHLAAQPIVRESYKYPDITYETNVMGTVRICESIRKHSCVRSFLNITTDKVYQNNEWEWGYRENDSLNGGDPYSNSKSCSELITECYRNSFLNVQGTAVSTARAGNVIGGGDFASDRIIPDCFRATMEKQTIIVRNPDSIRPYQHVLEPLFAYLLIAAEQYKNPRYASCYNVGPEDSSCITTGKLVDLFCYYWGSEAKWTVHSDGGPKEANFLKLDSSKIRSVFGWKPKWDITKAMEQTVKWTKVYLKREDILAEMDRQIAEYFKI